MLKKRKQHFRMLYNAQYLIVPSVVLVLAAVGFFVYFYVWHVTLVAPALPSPPLKELALSDRVNLGMWTQPDRLSDPIYTHILISQYSFITSDGQIHWDKFRPSPTKYNFSDLDKLVTFAEANHMSLQAHHLLWGEKDSLPTWLKNGNYTRQQLLQLIHDHINTVVGHYKGKIAEWTVVNEYFARTQHIYGLTDWWADHLGGGTGYIDDAFIWAHQADPKAILILNDFYNESTTSVSDAEYTYVKSAKARGVPIGGIGIQMHIDASRPPQKNQMIQNMQRFAALGTPVYITEFDINSNSVKGDAEFKAQLEARISATVVDACVESKSCVSFDVFGMTAMPDLLTWIMQTKLRSYLLTDRYQLEPSFYAFRQAWQEP